jgi:MYXO-CTERM domain-containing protein
MKDLITGAALFVAVCCCSRASGTPVVDQDSSVPIAATTLLAHGNAYVGQSVTTGLAGYLTQVELFAARQAGFLTPWLVDIQEVVDGQPTGNILSSILVQPDDFPVIPSEGSPPTLLVTLSVPVLFQVGDPFAILLHPQGVTGVPSLDAGGWGHSTDYPGGRAIYGASDDNLAAIEGLDLLFRTYVEPVPEPAGMTLAGFALMAMLALIRRRRRSP